MLQCCFWQANCSGVGDGQQHVSVLVECFAAHQTTGPAQSTTCTLLVFCQNVLPSCICSGQVQQLRQPADQCSCTWVANALLAKLSACKENKSSFSMHTFSTLWLRSGGGFIASDTARREGLTITVPFTYHPAHRKQYKPHLQHIPASGAQFKVPAVLNNYLNSFKVVD